MRRRCHMFKVKSKVLVLWCGGGVTGWKKSFCHLMRRRCHMFKNKKVRFLSLATAQRIHTNNKNLTFVVSFASLVLPVGSPIAYSSTGIADSSSDYSLDGSWLVAQGSWPKGSRSLWLWAMSLEPPKPSSMHQASINHQASKFKNQLIDSLLILS